MALKKSAGRWSGRKKSSNATAGKQDAQTDRKLQRAAERKRSPEPKSKKAAAVQTGSRPYPAPPLPKQHLEKPGLEADLRPRPQYQAQDYRGSGKLEGKVALITGGDSGIGRAVAVLFAREGADVAIVYLSEDEDAEETRQRRGSGGPPGAAHSGRRHRLGVLPGTVETTVQALGRLDILVNNAAFQEHADSLEDISDEQLDHTFRTNIFGYFYMARAAAAAPRGRRVHHQHRVDHRPRGQQAAAGLRLDQGRDPRLHQVAGAEPGRARDPGELPWRRARCGPRSIRRTRMRREGGQVRQDRYR